MTAAGPRYRDPRYASALAEQARLRDGVTLRPLPDGARLVAGADVSCFLYGRTLWGGLALCDAEDGFSVVASSVVRMEVDFPYIPGLLGFREVPVLLEALAGLHPPPDAVLVDAHGLAHPRRCGSASHFGVLAGLPTVGCAKSLLCGEYREPSPERRAWEPIELDGETVGAALRTRERTAPVFVSPGHLSDLPSALGLVLRCSPRTRIPEPLRAAHHLVNEARRRG